MTVGVVTADQVIATFLLGLPVAGFVIFAVLPPGWFDQFARPEVYRMRRANRWREVLRRNGGGR